MAIHVDGAEDEREHGVALLVFLYELLCVDRGGCLAADVLFQVDALLPFFQHLVGYVQFLFVCGRHDVIQRTVIPCVMSIVEARTVASDDFKTFIFHLYDIKW